MAFPGRTRVVPQCSNCLRNYAWASLTEASPATNSSLRQQIRGKKKMPNHSATVAARLCKDIKTFGKKGAVVPVERGRMRNQFFPQGFAEYVTMPEVKSLRLSGIAIERDFTFGMAESAGSKTEASGRRLDTFPESEFAAATPPPSSVKRGIKVEQLTPERSVELVDIFVRQHLDFYRQPTPEEKGEEQDKEDAIPPEEKTRSASSAAADLLAARAHAAKVKARPSGPRGIYGSVSTHDVLVAIRAAMATNDEATRVIFTEDEIEFVDLQTEGDEPGRVKHVGDFTVEIRIKGAENTIRRTVRVIPQDS